MGEFISANHLFHRHQYGPLLLTFLVAMWDCFSGTRCSTSQTGDLVKSDRAVDGIFGFGQQGMSVISQLASQGLAPRVFSHCLKGENGGGGILVLGEIVEPNMVFTPLVPSQLVPFIPRNCFISRSLFKCLETDW